MADALALARLWDLPSGYQGGVRAGTTLLAGGALPTAAGEPGSEGDGGDDALAAYADAGYDDQDAIALARLWGMADPGQAEEAAGHNLLAGQPLPSQP